MRFVYIKVPSPGGAGPGWDALHHALNQALAAAAAGSLTSWGTSVPSADASEDSPGTFHRIDIELQDVEAGLRAIRDTLLQQRAPQGTELHYTAGRSAVQQALSGGGWGDARVKATQPSRLRRP